MSSKTTTHMLLGSPSSVEGSVGKERSGCVQGLLHGQNVRDVPRAQVSVEGAGIVEHVAVVAERRGARRARVRRRHRPTRVTHPDAHTQRHVDVRVSSTTTTHMLLVSPRSKGSVGEKRSGCVQAYLMSFTFETFQLLKSPLKELASQNMYLGGGGGEVRGEQG